MPIRPERKHLYPANWKSEIVPAVRKRSGDCCETCGVRNAARIRRSTMHWLPREWWTHETATQLYFDIDGRAYVAETINHITWEPPITIVLTVAHLNHDETDNRMENLAHLCQLHHNRHDAKHRAANRKKPHPSPLEKVARSAG